MRSSLCQLQNSDGSHCRWIGDRELGVMIQTKEVTRISSRRDPVKVYRKRTLVQASESRSSQCEVTVSDAYALAGVYRVDDVWVERLIGFKLLPMDATVPTGGFITQFASVRRPKRLS